MKPLIYISLMLILLASCNGVTQKQAMKEQPATEKKTFQIPVFSADSAYNFVAAQLAFGPRVPGSAAHTACATWFAEKMAGFADTVIVQGFKARVYNKNIYDGKNIISVFNPEAKKRILLAAHWDSRPYADHDPDPANHRTPIDGANDGASGVGVLMEIARLMYQSPLEESLGVDIIFFDLEDYGPHNDERSYGDENYWALGAQHWSRNFHTNGYRAQFGILLDMVGAPGAIFPREYYSQQYASWVLDKVWKKASAIGYGHVFVNSPGLPITDDHVPVNRNAGIPMINIIHIDQNSSNGTFYEYWHTLNDNLSQIDPKTLRMVGELVTKVVYEEQ
jgi:glutaminyl-peptide cyclotransferase